MMTSKLDENRNKKDGAVDLRSKAGGVSDIDAPEKRSSTELLAEFLYCVMKKDYEKALQLCTKILEVEPNNSTAQEFYPLIAEKLERIKNEELEDSSSESSGTFSPKSSSSSENGIYLQRRSNSEKYKSYSSRSNNTDESSDFFDSNSTASAEETIKLNNENENLDFNLAPPKQSPSSNKKYHLVSPTPTEIIKSPKTKKTMTSSTTLLVSPTKTKILTDKNSVTKTTIGQKNKKLQNQNSSNVLHTTKTIIFTTKCLARN